jgi:hypothetical protein
MRRRVQAVEIELDADLARAWSEEIADRLVEEFLAEMKGKLPDGVRRREAATGRHWAQLAAYRMLMFIGEVASKAVTEAERQSDQRFDA